LQPVSDIGALPRRRGALAKTAKAPSALASRRCRTEQAFEQIAEIAGVGAAEVEILEPLRSARARLRPSRITAEASTERHLRIAVLVDLAAIIARTLVLVGQKIVGRGDLREALGGLGIVRVAVGVQLLGETPVGL